MNFLSANRVGLARWSVQRAEPDVGTWCRSYARCEFRLVRAVEFGLRAQHSCEKPERCQLVGHLPEFKRTNCSAATPGRGCYAPLIDKRPRMYLLDYRVH